VTEKKAGEAGEEKLSLYTASCLLPSASKIKAIGNTHSKDS
jgi:hypothetical protein